ncbi:hypothetical protein ACF0H5_008180 [Mactra antiquata]
MATTTLFQSVLHGHLLQASYAANVYIFTQCTSALNPTECLTDLHLSISDCGILAIPNGRFNASSGTTYGESAQLSCNTGYTLSGDTDVTCLSSGSWNGSATCTIVDCGTPSIDNAELAEAPKGTTYGEVALLSCSTGYLLDGASFVTCQADGNWSTLPTCNVIECGDPTPVNGESSGDTNFTYNSLVQISCNDGFDITGNSNITCQADGTWDGYPTCDPTDCGILAIPNGRFNASSGTTYGESAQLSCNTGYTLSGDTDVTCLSSGSWNGSATCTIVDCGTPSIDNAELAEAPKGTTYGEVALLSCSTGYLLDGASFVTCQADGNWSTLPTCNVIECGDPTPVNGESSGDTNFTYNSLVQISCNDGFDITGNSNITCQADGTWDGYPTCDPTDCGTPSIDNAELAEAPKGTTYGEVALLSCSTGYLLDGASFVTCQADGNWSTLPTCNVIECGDPTPVNGESSGDTNFTYDSLVQISCNDGFDITGNSNITCQADGTWDGYPTCDPTDCGTPSIDNAELAEAPKGTTYGEVALLSCSTGYLLDGASFVTCQADGNWSTLPTCNVIECGDPTPVNGESSGDTNFTYNSLVQISCNDGFDITGNSNITCQADGTWDGYPTCDPTDCGILAIPNGRFNASSGTTYGESAQLSCNTGYTLSGDTDVTCLSSGSWNGSATCTIVDCGTPSIDNAELAEAPKGTTYGEVALLSCSMGYLLDGASFVTCQADGNWSTLPTCNVIECGDPTPVNGESSGDTNFTYNSLVQISCNDGFDITGNSNITCQADGTWDGYPTCDPTDCGTPSIDNAELAEAPKGTTYGEVALLSCSTGYLLDGASFVTCQADGNWSTLPTCNVIECGDPTPVNGESSGDTNFTYNSLVQISCNDGFDITGNSNITCQADGTWDGYPTCDPTDCGTPSIDNAELAEAPKGTTYGEVALLSCSTGYLLDGASFVTCQADGNWSTLPTCNVIECGDPTPVNGESSGDTNFTYNSLVQISCNDGFDITGNSNITCQADGTWDGYPTCDPTDCGTPSIDNAELAEAPKGTTYGEVALLSCSTGYLLDGASFVTCQADGNWSTLPTCNVIECGDPTPVNGESSGDTNFTYNSLVQISCNDGFDITGNSNITCQADGTWDGYPTCDPTDCGTPSIDNAELAEAPKGTTYGEVALLSCSTGYLLDGASFVTCQADGNWSTLPTCNVIECGDPTPVNGESSGDTNFTYNSLVQISCNDGFDITGNSNITCQADGTWDGYPTCDPTDCGTPSIDNAELAEAPKGTTYGEVALLSCSTGYLLDGASFVTCQADGNWSTLPTCNVIECGDPTPVNGESSGDTNFTYDSLVQISCNDGFDITGNSNITCQADGTWDGYPTCDPTDCGTPSIDNAELAEAPKGTTYGEVALLSCSTGYLLDGASFVTCQADGNWSTLPTCNVIECGDPTPVNGESSGDTNFTYNSLVQISCNDGFDITENSNITCQADGTWDGYPTCDPTDCGTPSIDNAELAEAPKGTTYGEVALLSCSTGYLLDGASFVTCQADGNWSTLPTCNVIECGDPTPVNGESSGDTNFTYNSLVQISCNDGFDITGNSNITCQADGTWDGYPTCDPTDCGTPSIDNAELAEAPKGTTYGEVALLSCSTGYLLDGASFVTCQADGNWSTLPTCNVIECGDPTPVNGESSGDTNFTYNSLVQISCNDGFDITGNSNITCQADGTWDGYPTCDPTDCGTPSIDNAELAEAPKGTTYGEVALLSCSTGYLLDGASFVTCQADGNWSTLPTCNVIECGDPTPVNGESSGDTNFTYNSLVQISCNDGFDITGNSNITCQADGTWDGYPTCDPTDCGTPSIDNAELAEAPKGTTYGEVALLSCSTGYLLDGASFVTCQADGNWSTLPTCNVIECGDPTPVNGESSGDTNFTYNSLVQISCNDGFDITGNSNITCQADGTWDGYPTCDPTDCGTPSIDNAELAEAPKGTTYGEVALLSCSTGYLLDGASFVTCQADGNWSTLPTCNVIECGDPTPVNGESSGDTNFTYNSLVQISCNDGFDITGNSNITCQADGTWDGYPTCDPTDCGTPSIDNAELAEAPKGTTYGEVALLSCSTGYLLDGASFVTCQADGNWSTLPTCNVIECGDPTPVNGESSGDTNFTYNSLVQISCNDGFDITGNSNITCQADGTWDGYPTCDPTDCGTPSIDNAELAEAPKGTTYGEVALLSCSTGYLLDGASFVTCQADGNWSTLPTCNVIECGDPTPVNGESSGDTNFTYNSLVQISCNDGFDITGNSNITCQADGTWDGYPTCDPTDCGTPSIDNAELAEAPKGTTYGEVALLSCSTGYLLDGASFVTCQADGNWSTLPTCNVIECGDPTPVNGESSGDTNFTYNSLVQISCNDGFDITGNSNITCQADGTWDGYPTCDPTDCGTPSIDNAELAEAPKGTTYGEVALLSCSTGYLLDGASFVTCQADGNWSTLPTCNVIECGDPTPVNGESSGDTNFTYNSLVQISCNDGFDITGNSNITCQADGTWDGYPTCDPTDCGTPSIDNAELAEAPKGTTYGEVALLSCSTGYLLDGASFVTCQADGNWSTLPTCNVIECGDPTPVNGESSGDTNFTYNSLVQISCNDGFDITGNSNITCQADGTWDGYPTCDPTDCGTPSIDNAELAEAPKGTTYGEVALLSCSTGYLLDGASFVTCQADGNWSTLPTCNVIECGDPTPVNGESSGDTNFTYNSLVQISCNVGFDITGNSNITCQADGTWDGYPTCDPTDCGTPSIDNAELAEAPKGTTYGEVALLSCSMGYLLDGASFVTCQADGNWSTLPTCNVIECGDPTPVNGESSGDTNFTYNSLVQISCNDGFDITGNSNITCQADGTWDGYPTCDPTDCGTPSIDNAELAEAPKGTTYGEVALLSCSTGYLLDGASFVTCQADGNWSTLPTCNVIECGDPTPVNGESSGDTNFTYNSLVQISCNDGFDITGNSNITCQADGTWDGYPTCDPTDCGTPSIDNAELAEAPKGTTYGEVALLSCSTGYLLDGASFVTCQADGNWSTLPTCNVIECGDPTPVNGESSGDTNFTYNSLVQISCNDGFDITGNSNITCQADGTWDGYPTCDPTDCGTPSIDNAELAEAPKGTTYGEVALLSCSTGYLLDGASFVTCQADGNWSTLPTCNVIECGDPTPVNGESSGDTNFTYNSLVQISCNDGFDITGNSNITCQADGTWDGYPTCDPTDCGTPSIDNAELAEAPKGTTYGEVALLSCSTGYLLDGASFVTCQADGNWSTLPTCNVIECGDPTPVNGESSGDTNFTYNSLVQISCNDGFDITGNSNITCQADGTWDGYPTCDPTDCGTPSIDNAELAEAPKGTTYGEVALLSCSTGYLLDGASFVTCQADGNWSTLPTCNVIECGDPTPVNGESSGDTNFTYNSLVQISCNDGFDITGNSNITCQADGTWDGYPTCDPTDCGTPSIDNAELAEAPKGTTYGEVALLSCSTGYLLDGASFVTCQADGNWSTLPTCNVIECGDPTPVNGESSGDTNFTYNSLVQISCNDGFDITGNSNITCQADGTWDGYPTCDPTDCGTPSIDNAELAEAPKGTTYGEVALLSCSTGYLLDGASFVTCQADGNWSTLPTCNVIECGDPTPVNGESSGDTNFTYNSLVQISCNVGFDITGNSNITCQADGTWDGYPTCDPTDCGTPSIDNAELAEAPKGTTYGEVALLSCSTGYLLDGASFVTCQADGNWSTLPTCNVIECGDPTPVNGESSGDTNFTYNSLVQISCNDGFDITGNSNITCQADGTWDGYPTCDPTDCGTPSIDNAELAEAPKGTTYGEVALLSCSTGYLLDGASFVTCQADGNWSTLPTCNVIECGDPTPVNGESSGDTNFTYNSLVQISCNVGFDITGNSNITCQADGTWDGYPTCDPTDCGTPSIDNAELAEAPKGTTYGEVALLSCSTGYLLDGASFVTCQADGNWSTLPTCNVIECGDPTPVNGESSGDTNFTYNSLVQISCNDGFDITGNSNITCQADGTWDGYPTCDPTDCGTPSIDNAELAEAPKGTTYGEVALLSCSTGYLLDGASFVTCQADGNWSTLPTCNVIECGDPTPVNGESSGDTNFTYNSLVQISCNDGFDITGNSNITCQADGTWDGYPTCDPTDCGTPSIDNAELAEAPKGTTYGEVALLSCSTGYLLDGASFVTCQADGNWSTLPTCNVIECGDPTPVNGESSGDTNFTYNSLVQISCNDGFDITGNSNITCQADGTWDGYPTCDPTDCGTPSIDNAELAEAPKGTTYGEVALLSCSTGYLLDGASFVTCQADGNWSTLPTCNVIECGDPTPVNGESSGDTNFTYNSLVQISCNDGFDITGNSNITCQADGTWDGYPTCDPTDCGTPSIDNAELAEAPKGTTYGEVALLSCSTGYLLDGASFVTCQADGNWSTLPTCNVIECGDPTPVNGESSGDTNFTYNSLVQISCNDGFDITGNSNITCQADGTWDGYPTCDPTDCGTPSIDNAELAEAPKGTTYGEVALLSCSTGYLLDGASFVTCQADGNWSTLPTCNVIGMQMVLIQSQFYGGHIKCFFNCSF